MNVSQALGPEKLRDTGRWFITKFVADTARTLPAHRRVLDAGAGECTYKQYFRHCEYYAIDLGVGDAEWNYTRLDCIASLERLPLASETFDVVLCTQTLEHLAHPWLSLRELYRVLKIGGKLYVTAPMSHVEHQIPHDFFRYTSFGLNSLLTEAGFSSVQVEPFGGMCTRWAYELPRLLSFFPTLLAPNGMLQVLGMLLLPVKAAVLVGIRVIQCGLLLLEQFDTQKNDPFGWAAIAVKEDA